MCSNPVLDRDGVMAVVERHRASAAEMAALQLDALDVPDLFTVLDAVETARCQAPVIEHQAINHIAAQATEEQIGRSLKKVLADRLRITPREARRRIADAEQLGGRHAMTGEPLDPLWAATAAGQRAGEINSAHVAEIRRFFKHLPTWVDESTREQTEETLAAQATKLRPDELKVAAQRGITSTGGGTWLPMPDVIRMASHARHYLRIYDKHTGRELYLGETKRIATPGQRIVLHAKDRGCTRPGCTAPGYLSEVHHVEEWAVHHRTDIDTLTFVCGPDHKLLEEGWITRKNDDGVTEWLPPPHLDFGKPRTNGYFHPERYFRMEADDKKDDP